MGMLGRPRHGACGTCGCQHCTVLYHPAWDGLHSYSTAHTVSTAHVLYGSANAAMAGCHRLAACSRLSSGCGDVRGMPVEWSRGQLIHSAGLTVPCGKFEKTSSWTVPCSPQHFRSPTTRELPRYCTHQVAEISRFAGNMASRRMCSRRPQDGVAWIGSVDGTCIGRMEGSLCHGSTCVIHISRLLHMESIIMHARQRCGGTRGSLFYCWERQSRSWVQESTMVCTVL